MNVDLGSQKWPKWVLLRKIKQLFLRPARKLNLKYFSSKVFTGNNHSRQGKIYTLRKMTSKWPKINFSDMEFWLLAEYRIFRPRIFKITIKKSTLPEIKLKFACNDVLIFFDVFDRHNWLLDFRQKLHLFSDIYFCIDIMMEMVREDTLTTLYGSTWWRATNRNADTSTERVRQPILWHRRMETKRIFPDHFLKPWFRQWIRPKSFIHVWCKQRK